MWGFHSQQSKSPFKWQNTLCFLLFFWERWLSKVRVRTMPPKVGPAAKAQVGQKLGLGVP